MADATELLVQALRDENTLKGAADLFSEYAAPILSGIGSFLTPVVKSTAKMATKRKLQEMLGLRAKQRGYKRRRIGGYPKYRKGYERLSGFYGKFKPAFGKELKFFDTLSHCVSASVLCVCL